MTRFELLIRIVTIVLCTHIVADDWKRPGSLDPGKETRLVRVGKIPPKTSRESVQKLLEGKLTMGSGFEQLVYNPGRDHAILVFSSGQG